MSIKIDRASRSIVVVCSCGWRELAFSEQGARALAVRHETAAHAGTYHARDAARVAATRRRHSVNVQHR